MNRSCSILGFLVWIAATTAACNGASAAPFVVGKPLPPMSQKDLSGQTTELHRRQGKVVLVDFWATWCGPCHLQAEILRGMKEDYPAGELEIYGVNVGEDASTVRTALLKNPLPYPILLDTQDQLMVRHDIVGLPSVLVVGRDGSVAYFYTGLVDGPTLREVVDRALAGKTVPGKTAAGKTAAGAH
jgi:thiol-disulfide isomerase/thioredoxin